MQRNQTAQEHVIMKLIVVQCMLDVILSYTPRDQQFNITEQRIYRKDTRRIIIVIH